MGLFPYSSVTEQPTSFQKVAASITVGYAMFPYLWDDLDPLKLSWSSGLSATDAAAPLGHVPDYQMFENVIVL